MNTWNDIRSNWVNGNRSAVKNALAIMNKAHFCDIVLEALCDGYNAIDLKSQTMDGTLVDLIEILKSYRINNK